MLAEAEYALIVRWELTESGIKYIIPTTSYNRDYSAYAVNLQTGESIRFWTHVNGAKGSGKMNELNGDYFTSQELWTILRAYFLGELRYELADGSALLFGVTGKNCYLKGYEGELTAVDVPAQVEGYTVTEIAEKCFSDNGTLQSVVLPEGLQRISARAFSYCYMLERITLPNTLELIGEEAFDGCSMLQEIAFPNSLRILGDTSFWGAKSLKSLILPGTIEKIEYGVFMYCEKLARVVVCEGIKDLPDNLFYECKNVMCYYFPASLTSGLDGADVTQNAVIYAPEGSYALMWAAENGYAHVTCNDPADMPQVEYIVEGDFEFQLFNGEAAVSRYLGEASEIVIPSSAGGCPVTRILTNAICGPDFAESITVPHSVHTIDESAIQIIYHVFITNSDTRIISNAILRAHEYAYLTLHAPEGSTAQQYVVEREDSSMGFELWGEGTDPNARSVSDALALAGQVQQSAASFWETCNQTEYAWLKRIPDYDISAPEATAVLRVPREQFDELTLLMGGADNVAASFAAIVNTQFNLPYAKAAAKTANTAKLDPVADGSCAFVALCYKTDIVFAALSGDGDAQAALVCSSPKIIKGMTADYVNGIAAQYGISGECTVYDALTLATLLAP